MIFSIWYIKKSKSYLFTNSHQEFIQYYIISPTQGRNISEHYYGYILINYTFLWNLKKIANKFEFFLLLSNHYLNKSFDVHSNKI